MGNFDWGFLVFFLYALLGGLLVIKRYREAFFKDFTMLFSKQGWAEILKERHHLHFGVSGAISLTRTCVFFALALMQIRNFTFYQYMIPCLLMGFLYNVWWERKKQKKAGMNASGEWRVSISYRDCRYGAYGDAVVGMISLEVLKLLFLPV